MFLYELWFRVSHGLLFSIFCLMCFINVPIVVVFSSPSLIDCSSNYTYSSYVKQMQYEDAYVTAHFLIFNQRRIIDDDWKYSFLIDKIPPNIVRAYENHTVLPVYRDCNDQENANFYFQRFQYRSYFPLILGLFLNGVFFIISMFCVAMCCLCVLQYIDNHREELTHQWNNLQNRTQYPPTLEDPYQQAPYQNSSNSSKNYLSEKSLMV